MKRLFHDLTLAEILALAVKIEGNNAERFQSLVDYYTDYDEVLVENFKKFKQEELEHKKLLKQKWREKFGDRPIPEIDEEHIKDVVEAIDVNHGEHLIFDDLTSEDIKNMVIRMEKSAYLFYLKAAGAADDLDIKNLLSELAGFEYEHIQKVPKILSEKYNE